ncbi:GAF domain-containing sensor histidine kinase [Anabaena cylindrica FACHB-243]|uniref:histidine kinase n=1 Tax=Anabaena cylindrica (strain ATCC 27899 / PCC 7122) TaxID=272123 RepID=K9ZJG5_ANACC|nr:MULTISPECIES: GAF domain-containing sensor histidine kinase [Anabaena]AFZ58914.1 GAF sensor signal transduction histidine kinase [Anabaena cylindrica PCC 7122]MBD2419498.1 GAF domain-containing sensor histidine kinase [Anabaena cylindrica FACHB-243]MBY5283975.1 GAF domain-containing sensor histidine kinase [Anabaena sp. CCAP 1446/1C]MBY5310801.1 GAF domain-containing sensor histidine kinase [Anabaena sp. CCAP 1446/1C]MCM2408319.1 GAF domain-containing sensor histidine kinase [Anabaena sp. C
MIEPENKLFAPDDGWNSLEIQEQKRLKVLTELGLRQLETIPIFEEATQTAAHFLEAEISILGFIDQEIHWFKSSVGLSRLGLMNNLAKNRQLLRRESFCTQVVESSQTIVINDTKNSIDTEIFTSDLVQKYGIRSYLGAPLIDAAGYCLGALAVMDRKPRNFTERDIEFLQIIARWSMSEFERNRLLQGKSPKSNIRSISSLPFSEEQIIDLKISPPILETASGSTQQLKLELLGQLTQELRTPLTSVLGMAGVLGREIYGPLTTKQREYLEIIQHSGKYLLSLVNEITELGTINDASDVLNLVSVDIEMLCQQAIYTLAEVAVRRDQDIRLSIEPGRNRICPLDKDKVRQILYHLLFSVIQLSATGSIIRVHISGREDTLSITVWVSHPYLGDGITEIDPYVHTDSLSILEIVGGEEKYNIATDNQENLPKRLNTSQNLIEEQQGILVNTSDQDLANLSGHRSREKIGLLLSCHLAELHGGHIAIQGSLESGYRYVISLPLQAAKPRQLINNET